MNARNGAAMAERHRVHAILNVRAHIEYLHALCLDAKQWHVLFYISSFHSVFLSSFFFFFFLFSLLLFLRKDFPFSSFKDDHLTFTGIKALKNAKLYKNRAYNLGYYCICLGFGLNAFNYYLNILLTKMKCISSKRFLAHFRVRLNILNRLDSSLFRVRWSFIEKNFWCLLHL